MSKSLKLSAIARSVLIVCGVAAASVAFQSAYAQTAGTSEQVIEHNRDYREDLRQSTNDAKRISCADERASGFTPAEREEFLRVTKTSGEGGRSTNHNAAKKFN